MFYRMRTYRTTSQTAEIFHEFFRTWLLPTQLRHGARLVGRWETEDARVVAIWEYDDSAEYERVHTAVAADPESHRAQEYRRTLPMLFTEHEETFMRATV